MDLLFGRADLVPTQLLQPAFHLEFESISHLVRREIIHYISGNVIHEYPYSVHPIPCSLYVRRGHLTLDKASPTELVIFKNSLETVYRTVPSYVIFEMGPSYSQAIPKKKQAPEADGPIGLPKLLVLGQLPLEKICIHKYEKRHIVNQLYAVCTGTQLHGLQLNRTRIVGWPCHVFFSDLLDALFRCTRRRYKKSIFCARDFSMYNL